MLTWIVLATTLCAVAGGVLVVVGFRGRSTDAHPICRRCGFDLHGRFPWGEPTRPTCPDCGEALLSHRSVRPGARSRHPRLLACGCMLCFPGVILLLAGAIDSIAGKTTAAIKPTSLISSQVAGSTRTSATLQALVTRIATGGVQRGDVVSAIERALALQADRSINLDSDWIDLLETARRRGLLTPQQTDRYFQSAFDWKLMARPPASNSPLTFALQGFADRLGAPSPSQPLVVVLTCANAKFGGKPVFLPGTAEPFSTPTTTAPLVPNLLLDVVDSVGHRAPTGRSTPLATTWRVEVHTGVATGPLVTAWTQAVGTKVDVGGARYARDTLASTVDSAAVNRLAADLDVRSITIERDTSGATWASFTVTPKSLAADVVATLRITTSDGQIYDSLTPVTITPTDPRWPLLTAADATKSPWKVRVQLNGTPGAGSAKAAVDLIPLAGVARGTTLASPVWNGDPLHFEGVELKWAPNGEPVTDPPAPTPPASAPAPEPAAPNTP
jgi:hypothetical protein